MTGEKENLHSVPVADEFELMKCAVDMKTDPVSSETLNLVANGLSKVNKFCCPVCRKYFNDNNSLAKHSAVHNGDKPYKCNECNSSFKMKNQLVLHTRTHTNERPYSCLVCNASFIQSSHLKSHILSHSDAAPYPCNHCPKTFKRLKSLKIHENIHLHADKLLKCSDCDKSFPELKQLKSHMLVHDKTKAFKCDKCGKCFKSSSYIEKHKRMFCSSDGTKKSRIKIVGKKKKTKMKKFKHIESSDFCHPSGDIKTSPKLVRGRPKGALNKSTLRYTFKLRQRLSLAQTSPVKAEHKEVCINKDSENVDETMLEAHHDENEPINLNKGKNMDRFDSDMKNVSVSVRTVI